MQEEIKAITRKWGNSIAVVIPKEVVERQRIKEDEEVTIAIDKKRPKAGVLWGFGKDRFKKSAQQIKDELRIGWLSESDKEREKKWRD